ncbi:MAG TPA: hypothetical protein VGO01_08995 [Bradyrhizobium sp.]|nr:hypothetical protein [Bradyrhizobium sp.]
MDFLHQFCRSVVPKEDKALPRRRSGCRLRAVTVFAVVFSVQRACGSRGENALDLIRGVVSDRQPIRLSGLKCSCPKRCAFC